jgi:PAS domain S-box-containing protein
MTPADFFERKFMESVINASEDTIFVFNPQTGRVIVWNTAFRNISGYNDDEIQSLKAPNAYYSEEDLRKAEIALKEIMECGKTTLEMTLITKDGRKIPYEYSGTLLKDPDGNRLIVSVGRDISERKLIEKKLRESEERFRNITEQSLMGISVIQDGVFKYFNERVCEINGYSKEEMNNWVPNEFSKMVHPDDRKFVMEQAFKKQAGDEDIINQYSFRIVKKNGDVRWLEIFSKTINYQGSPADLVMTIDKTDSYEIEKKLKNSEEKYRKLFNAAPFAILLFNTDGIILDCNNQSESITGYSKEELIGHHFKDFNFYVDIASAGLDERQESINSGITPEPTELLLYKKDGSQFWAKINIEFVNMRGEAHIQAIIRDITDQKQATFKLDESYERLKELEKIINSSPGVVFLWKNSEGWPVEFVSENISQFGYTPEDFYSGKVMYDQVIHPDDLNSVVEEVNRYSNEGANEFMQEYRIITRSGEVKWLDDRTWVRRDSEGKITHFQGIVLDITKRKKTEQALKLSENNYKEAYDMANFYKDLFTHDMNNILQIINSSAEIITFQLGDSEKSLFIENLITMIKSQIDRGSKLISDVRTLTSLDEEQIALDKMDISRFLNESIKFVRKAYPERRLSIIAENLNQKYYKVGNELIQDVFDNILINAVKYNENTIVDIKINISRVKIEKKGYIQIEFIDNGIGVIDHRKEMIFQPGHREMKGTKGMGIGLSLVSKIINIFKGKIRVEDKVKGDYSQGSKFIVLLPETN